jgi:hypothetical protein
MSEIVPDANGDYHLGPHRFRFDVPDVLHMHFNGNVEPQHFEQFYATALRLVPDRPMYIMRDTRHGGLLNAQTRARVVKVVDPGRIVAIVSYGASFQQRVIVTMLTKALRAFKRTAPIIAFVDSETEARAWIVAHRNQPK